MLGEYNLSLYKRHQKKRISQDSGCLEKCLNIKNDSISRCLIPKTLPQKKKSQPSKDWYWEKSKHGIYLKSGLLKEYGFEHGFFTKEWSNLGPQELSKHIKERLSIHLVQQIHSSFVVNSSKAFQAPWPRADGLTSNKGNESLWIYTADCIPILFADTRKGFAGASHAGWRGISKGVLINTIKKLKILLYKYVEA